MRTPTLKNAAPPPIPGSHLRTPGPELLVPGRRRRRERRARAAPILPEALAQRPRRPKRSKPWFEEVFDEDYLRTLPFMTRGPDAARGRVHPDALRRRAGAEILDIACGYGRHAIELVQRGYNVTGLDLSLPLLIRAADESQRRALSVNFVHADMREMAFEEPVRRRLLRCSRRSATSTRRRTCAWPQRIGRALKPGGRFLLDIVNRDYIVSDLPTRVWWEGTGCVVLEEVDFNFHTSRIVTHRSIVFEDGRQAGAGDLRPRLQPARDRRAAPAGRLPRDGRLRRPGHARAVLRERRRAASLIVAEKRESDVAQPL